MDRSPYICVSLFALLLTAACGEEATLPVLSPKGEDGQYQPIPEFRFLNQDSQWVTPETFAGKAYVADFFFTSCPTICPTMARNMLRIQERFQDETRLLLLSHTIDPKRDTVGRLRHYAENLGALPGKWHFVTGDKDQLYGIAEDYFNIVVEDPTLPDGFDHSARFVLVGPQRRIRAYCTGTDTQAVDEFMNAIETLLHEMDPAPAVR